MSENQSPNYNFSVFYNDKIGNTLLKLLLFVIIETDISISTFNDIKKEEKIKEESFNLEDFTQLQEIIQTIRNKIEKRKESTEPIYIAKPDEIKKWIYRIISVYSHTSSGTKAKQPRFKRHSYSEINVTTFETLDFYFQAKYEEVENMGIDYHVSHLIQTCKKLIASCEFDKDTTSNNPSNTPSNCERLNEVLFKLFDHVLLAINNFAISKNAQEAERLLIELDKTKKQVDEAKKQVDQTKKQVDQTKKQVDQTKKQVDQTKKQVDQTKKQVKEITPLNQVSVLGIFIAIALGGLFTFKFLEANIGILSSKSSSINIYSVILTTSIIATYLLYFLKNIFLEGISKSKQENEESSQAKPVPFCRTAIELLIVALLCILTVWFTNKLI